MSNSKIEIRGCISEKELIKVVDLCDAAFPKTSREYFERHVLKDMTLEKNDTRILLKDGKIVSSVQVFPRTISVSTGTIMFGGIGNVATLPSERQNGYAGILLNNAIKYIGSKDIPVSMLTTHINSYYEKFGFKTILRTNGRLVSVKGKEHNGIRVFNRAIDFINVVNLYNDFNNKKTGTIVRDEKYWLSQFEFSGENKDLFLIYEQDKELKGFIRANKKENYVEIIEYAFKSADKTILTKLIENLSSTTGSDEFELLLTKKEEANLDPKFTYSLKDEKDFMVCFLDEKLNPEIKNELISDRNLNFWQSDFF
jgi:predicted acetyltransferase